MMVRSVSKETLSPFTGEKNCPHTLKARDAQEKLFMRQLSCVMYNIPEIRAKGNLKLLSQDCLNGRVRDTGNR